MADREVEELRARVEELERKLEILFRHTGATDWETEAQAAPEVSAAVYDLLTRGENRKAAKLYIEETGATMGQAAAALGEAAKRIRGEA